MPLSPFSLILAARSATALVIPRSGVYADQNDRTWQHAVQNINGMTTILALIPVQTGKNQNVKLAGSRIFPASHVLAGVGAGRVLAKVQLGVLLWSFQLYRNTIGEALTPHEEYINSYAPKLNHFATATPERHTKGAIESHNIAENYMVEAWFRAQGTPAEAYLDHNSHGRAIIGLIVYIGLYAAETYIAARNAAVGTANAFVTLQVISAFIWVAGSTILHFSKSQGMEKIGLNNIESPDYRCFTMPIYGDNVKSEAFGFDYFNVYHYKLFPRGYEHFPIRIAGSLVAFSGLLDLISTILLVGFTYWAYPWLGIEIVIIFAKVLFCLEPLRHTEIAKVVAQGGFDSDLIDQEGTVKKLPLTIPMAWPYLCNSVTTDYNIVEDATTHAIWRSTTAGSWIGQEYVSKGTTKYLSFVDVDGGQLLGLVEDVPSPQKNHALDREFLATLKILMETNKVPSREFVNAVERTVNNIRETMEDAGFQYGTKELIPVITKAKNELTWRTWL